MFKKLASWGMALALALVVAPLSVVQAQNSATSQSNVIYPAVSVTASGQTSTAITLGRVPSGAGGAFSVGNISVNATALTTITFQVQGSSDGGVTYNALNVNLASTPGTVATTTTATSVGLYQVNLTGITNVRFVTSGTFTGTGVTLTLTAAPNGIIARNSASGGGGNVQGVTATSPVQSTGGTNPVISCPTCNTPSNSPASVSNADGTLTISPTTGTVVASIALGHVNTWSAAQTFSATAAFTNGTTAMTFNTTGSTVGVNGGTSRAGASAGQFRFDLVNPTAATSGQNYVAPFFGVAGTSYNGTASVNWGIDFGLSTIGTGATPAITVALASKNTVPGTVNYTLDSPLSLISTTAPTLTMGAGAGGTPTGTAISGNNNSGHFTFTTGGTAPSASATVATITFNGTMPQAPNNCTINPRNAASALQMTALFTGAPSTTAFSVSVGTTAIATGTYDYGYHCI